MFNQKNQIIMTYKKYSKLSQELSALNEAKYHGKSNQKINKRINDLVELLMPFAF